MRNRFTRSLLLFVSLFAMGSRAASPAEGAVSPAPVLPAVPVQPTPRPAPAPAPGAEHTVLLLGDSLIATGFGDTLQAELDAHPSVRCRRKAKSSTGLSRPDFFDWMEAGRQEVERHQPEVVVVILGGNDGQALRDKAGGSAIAWGQAEWETAYRQRVQDFLGVIAAPGRKIVWLELPTTGLRRFEKKLALIRGLQREVIAAREDAVHVDTHPFFTDARGHALQEAHVEGFRKPMRLRMTDGVHFTVAGGRYFADKVYPEVLGVLGLEPAPRHAIAPAHGTAHSASGHGASSASHAAEPVVATP
ncbi:DUF459 domain-containing protein [Corallococcus sp. M34]|nr:DUF459 domain-containing protein [Citreicoccus inhibens]